MRILLFSEVTLFKYNVSTILSPIVGVEKKTISCCEIISFPVRMSQDSTISRLMLTVKDRAKPVV